MIPRGINAATGMDFNGLSWPHVTVGTLKKNVPVTIPIWKIDPDIPIDVLRKVVPPIPPDIGAPIRTGPNVDGIAVGPTRSLQGKK